MLLVGVTMTALDVPWLKKSSQNCSSWAFMPVTVCVDDCLAGNMLLNILCITFISTNCFQQVGTKIYMIFFKMCKFRLQSLLK
jgi:hypothetical protein